MNTILNAKSKRQLGWLADARSRKKQKQEEAAGEVGVKQSTFSDWESGAKCPSICHRQKLAEYIGVSRQELAAYLDDFFSSKLS